MARRRFQARARPRRREGDDKGLRLRTEMTMTKETKFFRKQAEKAERMARATSDEEASRNLINLAMAYRSQADALKRSKKLKKESGKKAELKAKRK